MNIGAGRTTIPVNTARKSAFIKTSSWKAWGMSIVHREGCVALELWWSARSQIGIHKLKARTSSRRNFTPTVSCLLVFTGTPP